VNFVAWSPIFAVVAGLTIASLWHIATHPVPHMPKWAWALFIVFAGPVGPIVYFVVAVVGADTERENDDGGHAR